MARLALKSICFFNGIPTTLRGLAQLVTDKQAELHYDTSLQLIGLRVRTGTHLGDQRYYHPAGVEMTPAGIEAAAAEAKKAS